MKKLILGILTAALIALGLVGAPADAAHATRTARSAPCAPDAPCTVAGFGSITITPTADGLVIGIKFKFPPTARVAAGSSRSVRGTLVLRETNSKTHKSYLQSRFLIVRNGKAKVHVRTLPHGSYRMALKFTPQNKKAYRTSHGHTTFKV